MFGVTEALVTIQSVCILAFIYAETGGMTSELFSIGGYLISIQSLYLIFAGLNGFKYNFWNFYQGYIAAEDKTKAIGLLIPIIMHYI